MQNNFSDRIELAHSAALAFDRDGKILFSVSAADDKSITPEEPEYFYEGTVKPGDRIRIVSK